MRQKFFFSLLKFFKYSNIFSEALYKKWDFLELFYLFTLISEKNYSRKTICIIDNSLDLQLPRGTRIIVYKWQYSVTKRISLMNFSIYILIYMNFRPPSRGSNHSFERNENYIHYQWVLPHTFRRMLTIFIFWSPP